MVRHFYQLRLDEYLSSVSANISARTYFTGMFERFLRYKQELILLDQRGLLFLLLEELSARIVQVHGNSKAAVHSLACNYHIGGVFNSFRYWLFEDMATPPDELAHQCLMFLPRDFCPYLLPGSGMTALNGLCRIKGWNVHLKHLLFLNDLSERGRKKPLV